MYCTKCGAQLQDNANFCTRCGAKAQRIIKAAYRLQYNHKRDDAYKNVHNRSLQECVYTFSSTNCRDDTVLVSSNMACIDCSKYNNRVFSLFGKSYEFPTLPDFLAANKCPTCRKPIGFSCHFPRVGGDIKKDIEDNNKPLTDPYSENFDFTTESQPTKLDERLQYISRPYNAYDYSHNVGLQRCVANIKEWGKSDAVSVMTSSYCPSCSRYNGRIFSLFGECVNFPTFPDFLTAEKCPTCGVLISVCHYFPGINGDPRQDVVRNNKPLTDTRSDEERAFWERGHTNRQPQKKTTVAAEETKSAAKYNTDTLNTALINSKNLGNIGWYISLSFGKSSSSNYLKAVHLAKSAPKYIEDVVGGKIVHQAIYSSKQNDYLKFIMLYELVGNWKSSFVIINGEMIDRKIIGKLNYCYGDRCRQDNPKFCYGASYWTENPFGCHRLQISAYSNPWWTFYVKTGHNTYTMDRERILEQINNCANIYHVCPCFNYNNIITQVNKLPKKLTAQQVAKLQAESYR